MAWRARKQRELDAARAEVDEARRALDEERRRLVTTVSHELRTPLTLIQGVANTLASRWDRVTEAQRLDMIDVIASNVASLDASILHFIDAGALERGETALHLEHVALQPLIDQVTSKLAAVLAGYPLRVSLEVQSAWADRAALARIVELLLSNAARFSSLASPIHLRVYPVADGVEVAVSDRGIGIAPRHLPHVFEPFWRADVSESGVSRGAGLGLTIVKELAELHGGSVRALSSRGRGSTFHVVLPGPVPLVSDPRAMERFG